jgi:hypothetical protein
MTPDPISKAVAEVAPEGVMRVVKGGNLPPGPWKVRAVVRPVDRYEVLDSDQLTDALVEGVECEDGDSFCFDGRVAAYDHEGREHGDKPCSRCKGRGTTDHPVKPFIVGLLREAAEKCECNGKGEFHEPVGDGVIERVPCPSCDYLREALEALGAS